MSVQRTLAFSVERVRERLYRNVQIPPELLTKALKNLDEQLEAKETKFFTKDGKIETQVDVVNYEAQQRAQDQIFKIAGAYAREREEAPKTPAIALEIDQEKGLLRLVIGAEGALSEGGDYVEHSNNNKTAVTRDDPNVALGAPHSLPPGDAIGEAKDDAEVVPQVIKTRNKTVEEIKREAFGLDG